MVIVGLTPSGESVLDNLSVHHLSEIRHIGPVAPQTAMDRARLQYRRAE